MRALLDGSTRRAGERIALMDRRAFLSLSAASLFAQTRTAAPGPVVVTSAGRVRGVSDAGVQIFRACRMARRPLARIDFNRHGDRRPGPASATQPTSRLAPIN